MTVMWDSLTTGAAEVDGYYEHGTALSEHFKHVIILSQFDHVLQSATRTTRPEMWVNVSAAEAEG